MARLGSNDVHQERTGQHHSGLTPARHVIELRVQRAARLLTTTSASLQQIAEACGFADANLFCKVFRRLRQQSPGVYRRSIR